MRTLIVAVSMLTTAGIAAAADTKSSTASDPGMQERSRNASPHSTGQSSSPADRGQAQPQGHTGPLNTTSGGAPAESPQGQTPPGMQSAPEGSDKTIVDEKK